MPRCKEMLKQTKETKWLCPTSRPIMIRPGITRARLLWRSQIIPADQNLWEDDLWFTFPSSKIASLRSMASLSSWADNPTPQEGPLYPRFTQSNPRPPFMCLNKSEREGGRDPNGKQRKDKAYCSLLTWRTFVRGHQRKPNFVIQGMWRLKMCNCPNNLPNITSSHHWKHGEPPQQSNNHPHKKTRTRTL